MYDTVYHACNPKLHTNVKLFYNDNDKVIVYGLVMDYNDNFFVDEIFDKVENALIINPVKNVYNENHKFYNLANMFVMKPLAHYTKILKNACKIIVSNSCFMCLLLNVKANTQDVYYISIHDYCYLFDDKYNFPQLIKKM